jgi:DNA-binding transcriptional LysR family regulator
MPRADLGDLSLFLAVVEAGSFVAGGQAMGLTRSAAGKAVSRLEGRLGVRLLNRTTRRLSLTEEGRTLHERGLRILAEIEDAEASVAGRGGTPRGLLRLTAPDAFGRLVLLPLIREYLAAWPEVQAEVSFSDRLADIVEEGFDLALRIGRGPADTRLVSRVVARYGAVLCAAPAYLAARGTPAAAEDLAGHDCLLFTSRGRRAGWRLRGEDGAPIRTPGRSRLRLDSGEAIRDAAVAGLGIAYLPSFVVAGDLGAGRLRRVLPGLAAEEVEIVALYPSRRLLEPRVRRFIDLVAEALATAQAAPP